LILIVVMLFAGYAAVRFGWLEASAADAFHSFVIYVCLPATIWKLLPGMRFERELWLVVLMPWLLLGVSAAATLALARARGYSRAVTGALLLCVPLGNTSFLGFPLVAALLGEPALRYAVLYDQLGSFLALSSYGLYIAARFGAGAAPSGRETLARILRFPPFVALLLAFTPLPGAALLAPLWARLSDALVPIAMFAVGMRLEWRPPRPMAAVALGLGLKLVAMPALAWLLLRALDAPETLLRAVVLEAGMPAMITAGAVAMLAGLAPELVAALVGYGVLFGIVTVPAWAWLLSTF
jgi:predicted permease